MIFATVGTQLSFDRLIFALDAWARLNPGVDVKAQVGHGSAYAEGALQAQALFSHQDTLRCFETADIIVSHAGMGSILTAKKLRKPIIIMPREHARGEHRNDHQLATAGRMKDIPGIFVAHTPEELAHYLDRREVLAAGFSISEFAPEDFLRNVEGFIFDGKP